MTRYERIVKEESHITLDGTTYHLKITGVIDSDDDLQNLLRVELSDLEGREWWHASFSRSAIEDITRKTGNFKRFSVFVRMLLSAVNQSTDTVKLAFVSAKDIQALSKVKQVPQPDEDKLYMILTYAVAFDRVHYPLPLVASTQATSVAREIDDESDSFTARRIPTAVHTPARYSSHSLFESLSDIVQLIERLCMEYRIPTHSPLRRKLLEKTRQLRDGYSEGQNPSRLFSGKAPSRAGSKSEALRSSSRNVSKAKPIQKTYMPLKSMPLQSSLKQNLSITSRSSSRSNSPFRRFDPTLYVQEKSRKLQERRNSSREWGAGSPSGSRTRRTSHLEGISVRSPTFSSTRGMHTSPHSTRSSLVDKASPRGRTKAVTKSATPSKSRQSAFRNISHGQKENADIDAKLERLFQYIAQVGD
ncbi:hypothetical protein DFS34DRAFT_168309 [Phlyctochytrium arcticum]|nr:hypothetical protein DFS34DRAFT_168309 [Phlyctochytrium arcticum]